MQTTNLESVIIREIRNGNSVSYEVYEFLPYANEVEDPAAYTIPDKPLDNISLELISELHSKKFFLKMKEKMPTWPWNNVNFSESENPLVLSAALIYRYRYEKFNEYLSRFRSAITARFAMQLLFEANNIKKIIRKKREPNKTVFADFTPNPHTMSAQAIINFLSHERPDQNKSEYVITNKSGRFYKIDLNNFEISQLVAKPSDKKYVPAQSKPNFNSYLYSVLPYLSTAIISNYLADKHMIPTLAGLVFFGAVTGLYHYKSHNRKLVSKIEGILASGMMGIGASLVFNYF